jgi:phage gp36-like protein
MAYATQSDLVVRFGSAELAQLTDPVAGAQPDASVIARALADADAQVDLALSKRYALPLATVPAVLVRIAADIARYLLWNDRATEQVRARYKDACVLLDRIAAGDVQLGEAAALAPATAAAAAVVARAPTRRWTDTVLDAAFGPGGL